MPVAFACPMMIPLLLLAGRVWLKAGKVVIDAARRVLLCDDCPCEVGTSFGFCCQGLPLPNTLYATIANVSNCPAQDGIVVTLTKEVAFNRWTGYAVLDAFFCVRIAFSCTGAVTPTCDKFGISVEYHTNSGGTCVACSGGAACFCSLYSLTRISCDCSPAQFVFDAFNGPYNNTTGSCPCSSNICTSSSCPTANKIRVTITQ